MGIDSDSAYSVVMLVLISIFLGTLLGGDFMFLIGLSILLTLASILVVAMIRMLPSRKTPSKPSPQ